MGDNYILKMVNIEKEYYGNKVLKGISFDIRPGEIMALVGENGAGKSTLMNVLFGMEQIHRTGGFKDRVFLTERKYILRHQRKQWNLGYCMKHQEFRLLPGFTITENIKLSGNLRKPGMAFKGIWKASE
ncbi:MAG: ATP-binding cassette domain-containing protein [Lachnospiraceae bacterium]